MSITGTTDIEGNLMQLTTLAGVRHALLVRSDGLLIARHTAPHSIQDSLQAAEADQNALIRAAAMTATALSLNKRIVGALGGGTLTETSITGTEGSVFLYAAGPRAVLALIIDHSADTPLLAQQVAEVLGPITAALPSRSADAD